MEELAKLGNDAKPFLRAALKGQPSLEKRRRVESLLDRLPRGYDVTDFEIPSGLALVTIDDLLAQNLKKMHDPDTYLSGDALEELAPLALYSDRVIPAIMTMLDNGKNEWVRRVAALNLADIGFSARSALPILKEGLHDPDMNIRKVFQMAFEKLDKAASRPAEETRTMVAIAEDIRELKKPKEKPAPEKPTEKPAAKTITIRGKVVDDATGEPIGRLITQGGKFDPSDPKKVTWGYSESRSRSRDGSFSTTIRWAEGWTARIVADGYIPQPVLGSAPPANKNDIEVTIRLKRGPNVRGAVLDHAGKPVKDAAVFAIGPTGVNLAAGQALCALAAMTTRPRGCEPTWTAASSCLLVKPKRWPSRTRPLTPGPRRFPPMVK